ncbi:MAG: HD domain-containing protein [Candidatus Omnitrophica bacterium]|nr:HD domain-containing protein [Candidatus Omnitrophota bacterium]
MANDWHLVKAVQAHLKKVGVRTPGRYGHLEWVAKMAAWGAEKECDQRGIVGPLREEIVRRAWRLGLLHDVESWLGWGDDHAKEGARVAVDILEELGIDDPFLGEMVGLHNQKNVPLRDDPAWDIPFFVVFGADHINWGLEWVEDKWKEYQRLGYSPLQAMDDYQFMLEMVQSPNLNQTIIGREWTIPYLNFGIEIIEHVRSVFLGKQN